MDRSESSTTFAKRTVFVSYVRLNKMYEFTERHSTEILRWRIVHFRYFLNLWKHPRPITSLPTNDMYLHANRMNGFHSESSVSFALNAIASSCHVDVIKIFLFCILTEAGTPRYLRAIFSFLMNVCILHIQRCES